MWPWIRARGLLSVASLMACGGGGGDGVSSYSEPVGINMTAKSNDVSGGSLTLEKNITTESGNPYGEFVNNANKNLGHDPGRIELVGLVLSMGTGTGVSGLQEVFTGTVTVSFVISGSGTVYAAGNVPGPSGVGPIQLQITFQWSSLAAVDQADFRSGNFKVRISGQAAAGFDSGGKQAPLLVTFTFAAYP